MWSQYSCPSLASRSSERLKQPLPDSVLRPCSVETVSPLLSSAETDRHAVHSDRGDERRYLGRPRTRRTFDCICPREQMCRLLHYEPRNRTSTNARSSLKLNH